MDGRRKFPFRATFLELLFCKDIRVNRELDGYEKEEEEEERPR